MACCGSVGGILLGSATGAVLAATMSPETLENWGWRIPFLFGAVIGLVGLVLRRLIQESPRSDVAKRSPLLEVLHGHRLLLARLAGLAAFNAVGFYLLFVYIVSWLQFA